MRIVELEQRSPEWLAWRAGGVGSSDAAAVLGVSPWKTRQSLFAEKVKLLSGGSFADRSTSAMRRGRDLEPRAAAWYTRLYGRELASPCAEHGTHGFVRASFDGLSADGVVVEIKCPNGEDHSTALSGRLPLKYVPQCEHLMLVASGAARVLHYVSYAPSEPRHRQFAVVTFRPEPARLAALLEAEAAFWAEVLAEVKRTRP